MRLILDSIFCKFTVADNHDEPIDTPTKRSGMEIIRDQKSSSVKDPMGYVPDKYERYRSRRNRHKMEEPPAPAEIKGGEDFENTDDVCASIDDSPQYRVYTT